MARRWFPATAIVLLAIGGIAWMLATSGGGEDTRSSPFAAPRDVTTAQDDARPVEPRRTRAGLSEDAPKGQPSEPAAGRAWLVVLVKDAPTNAPLAGARVEVRDGGTVTHGETDAEGLARIDVPSTGSLGYVATAPGRIRGIGAVIGDLRRAEISLARGVAVEGRVVRSEDGTAIEGATVEATEGGSRGGAFVWSSAGPLATATSGNDGRFRLDGMPPAETATLRATAPGRAATDTTVVPAADAVDTVPVEIRLEAGGTVRGVVRDRGGRSVAGASVYLVPAHAPSLLETPDATVTSSRFGHHAALRATTRDDGAYAVDGVPFGSVHSALAKAKGHATSEPLPDIRVDADHPVASCDIVLRTPGALDVTVLTTGGEPVDGAEVELQRKATEVATLYTDAAGHASSKGLDVTSYVVTVRAKRLPMLVRFYAIEEGATKRVELRLAQGVAIEGTVVDDGQRPLAGARVFVFRPPWENQYSGLPESEGEAVSDADGRFRVEGLHEGPHEVWAQEKGRTVTGDLASVAAPAAGVRLVSLRRATLRFSLVPPVGATPPGELHVHIGSLVHKPTWADGPVEIPGLDPGTARVEFRIAGFVPFERDVAFAAGEVSDLGEIALDAGWELRGRVEDASGQALANASIRCGDVFTPTFQDVTTGASGAFRLQHLPAGEVEVQVRADGFLSRDVTVRVGRDEAEARVVLVRGGLLRGTVRRPDGTTAADVFVHVFDAVAKAKDEEMDDREAWARTDARGAFEARLLPGRYHVEVERKVIGRSVIRASADVDLADGATTPLVVDLPE